MRKKQLQSLLALLLALVLALGSTSALAAITAGQTISSDSKWINSDIIGAVDENTKVSIKDDFHTAVNLEWFLTTEDGYGPFETAEEMIYQHKLDIVLNEAEIDPANADAIGLSSERLAHDLKLVQNFSSLSGEWEYRNAYGLEPARPFLEAIASIKTMDELSDYLFNVNGMNITGVSLLEIGVSPDPETQTTYMATIQPNTQFSLGSQDNYLMIAESGLLRRNAANESAQYLLQKMGYSEKEIQDLLKKCYRFEGRLAENVKSSIDRQTETYENSAKMLSLDELTKLAGNYPVARQFEAYGVAPQEQYRVYEQSYIKLLNRLYQPRYLEEIKAMLTVQTVLELMPLLDEDTFKFAYELFHNVRLTSEEEEGDPTESNSDTTGDTREDIAEFVFDNYLQNYLPGPMDQIYVAAYCTPELKNNIRSLIDEIIDYYREMIMSVDWLSENARKATVEKLDYMVIRCVYPDAFVDYSGLNFKGCRNNEGGTLPQAIAAINLFHQKRELQKIGQKVERTEWDMSAPYKSTSVCQAFYMPSENSINILAGFLTGEIYTSDMAYEELLAMVGVCIGHEITHAFDTGGYKFNKYGHLEPWWSIDDVEAFDLRASDLIKYYNTITPYPNAFVIYNGKNVSGEAIADMGAVKCMLNIAKAKPDFDYDLFFRTYAKFWRCQNELAVEKALVDDEHPLGFLRTNVTLAQFEEFQKTYDIQPGDGMYVAPENRINVW